ncbi:cold-regulated protein 27-like [Actinidia eriantha]|uniref:cold-regulated protein 27-like n=1 Tax=Actinidia eriantha TaxID=165200 RepID=UPI0025830C5D|nr:cold-regulated protein 27-like [Actinidia eriantha]
MEGVTHPRPRATPESSWTSEATAENASIDSVERLSQDSLGRDPMSTEWTDEKHSLYLKSMEASFVDDLYNSFDLLGWRSQREQSPDPKFSGQKHASTRMSSGQFKVLQSGRWGNINFEIQKSQVNKADKSGVILANPWIRHFRSARRKKILASYFHQEKAAFGSLGVRASGKIALTSAALAANLEQFSACRSHLRQYDSVGSNTEVTDQNFVDEDVEGGNASHKCNAKRMKTSVVATPSNDQVVPFGKFPVTTDVTENSFSPERERPRSSSDLKIANKHVFP